jgi:hypothetical protein
MDKLTYVAQPGQITLGVKEDPLVNTEPAYVEIEGFVMPAHIDYDGHPLVAGFDVVSMRLVGQTEFRSANAIVYAPGGRELHWRQVPQAIQWADEKARFRRPDPLNDPWVKL